MPWHSIYTGASTSTRYIVVGEYANYLLLRYKVGEYTNYLLLRYKVGEYTNYLLLRYKA